MHTLHKVLKQTLTTSYIVSMLILHFWTTFMDGFRFREITKRWKVLDATAWLGAVLSKTPARWKIILTFSYLGSKSVCSKSGTTGQQWMSPWLSFQGEKIWHLAQNNLSCLFLYDCTKGKGRNWSWVRDEQFIPIQVLIYLQTPPLQGFYIIQFKDAWGVTKYALK